MRISAGSAEMVVGDAVAIVTGAGVAQCSGCRGRGYGVGVTYSGECASAYFGKQISDQMDSQEVTTIATLHGRYGIANRSV